MVVFFAHNFGGEDSACGFKGINRGVNTLGRYISCKNSCCVKVGKGGRRSGVGKVIRRYVNRLN